MLLCKMHGEARGHVWSCTVSTAPDVDLLLLGSDVTTQFSSDPQNKSTESFQDGFTLQTRSTGGNSLPKLVKLEPPFFPPSAQPEAAAA